MQGLQQQFTQQGIPHVRDSLQRDRSPVRPTIGLHVAVEGPSHRRILTPLDGLGMSGSGTWPGCGFGMAGFGLGFTHGRDMQA